MLFLLTKQKNITVRFNDNCYGACMWLIISFSLQLEEAQFQSLVSRTYLFQDVRDHAVK